MQVDRVVQGTLFGEALLSANVAALLADESGHYVAANDAACTLTGFSRHDLTASKMGSLAADAASARIYTELSRGPCFDGQKRIRCWDGHIVDCTYRALTCMIARLPYYVLLLWPPVRVQQSIAIG